MSSKDWIDDSLPDEAFAELESNIDNISENQSLMKKHYMKYLTVTNLSQQIWCEQQMLYKLEKPDYPDSEAINIGKSIHLARELEQPIEYDEVQVESREDKFSLKILNLIQSIQVMLDGEKFAREIDIFGMPYNCDIFVVGKIDEIRFDEHFFEFSLVELKTRSTKNLPSNQVQNTYSFQAMLYKKMFDDIIKNKLNKITIANKMRLDLHKDLNSSIVNTLGSRTFKNLDELLTHLFEIFKAIPMINDVLIEYVNQNDMKTIDIKRVEYDDSLLEKKFKHLCELWNGEREKCGVDIEETWKCNCCSYKDVCEWREKKAKEYSESVQIAGPSKRKYNRV